MGRDGFVGGVNQMSTPLEQDMAHAYKQAIDGKPVPRTSAAEYGHLLFELGYIAGQQAALKEVRATLRSPSSPFSSNTTSN